MAFDAKLVFTGACGVVPKKNPYDPPGAFCVLLPDAWNDNPFPPQPRRSSVDGTVLQRHLSYLYYTTEHLPGNPVNKGTAGIWYLNGHRLIVNPYFEGSEQLAAWGSEIDGLASFEDVTSPGRTDALLSVSKAVMNPQQGRVVGQVLFKHGVLDAPPKAQPWVFDSYLLKGEDDFRPRTKSLNHEVVVTLRGIKRLEIMARSLYTIEPDKIFVFDAGPLEITVANLCEINPIRWGNNTAGNGLKDDEDFRWHYELVDDPQRLADTLDPFRCPIPRLTRGDFAGGGLNCFPIRFPAVDFGF